MLTMKQEIYLLIHVKSWRAHKVLRMQPSIQFWFKETGCRENELLYAKYSILHGHEQLFASKYKTCLPSEEQLREEIEIQKRFYYLQKE